MPKMAFTDAGVRSLQDKARRAFATGASDRKEHRYFERQSTHRGNGNISLMMNLSYTGGCSWHVLYYRNGRPVTQKIGSFPDMSVRDARVAAKATSPTRLAASNDAGSFKTVAEQWLDAKVRGKLRTEYEIKRQLKVYVYPTWADLKFLDIKRSTLARLLDDIQYKRIEGQGGKGKGKRNRMVGGAVQADMVKATLNSLMKWFEGRSDDYMNPARGVERRNENKKSRKRVLTDDEIRTIWNACDEAGAFGAAVRLLLLTGQRLAKIKFMKWRHIEDGVWTIATEDREKGNAGEIKLPRMALDVIEAQPKVVGCPYVLPAPRGGKGSMNSFSFGKRQFDKRVPDVEDWTLHDLRRTARTLMSRIGVKDDIAERVLGHLRGNPVARTYNRHEYTDEKSKALKRLADHIALIINPPDASNVVQIKKVEARVSDA